MTEEEAIAEAKKAMSDIGWDYDTTKKIEGGFSSREEQIKRADSIRDHPNYQAYLDSKKSYWVIGFEFNPESEIYNNTMFVQVDDETGNAYYLRHSQAGFKLEKSEDGKYSTINDWVRGSGDH
jgi:hypothetical protein